MNILFSTAASLPSGEIPVLIWATIGGVLVFVGLAAEKFADLLNDRYLGGPYKPHKGLELAGWCILMFGIFIEIAVAGWSANDAWQVRQMAIKNDPRKQPIVSISATANLLIKGDGEWHSPVYDENWCGIALFFNGTFDDSTGLYKDAILGNVVSFKGTNMPQMVFSLFASKTTGVELVNLYGQDKIEYDITFRQDHIFQPDIGMGKPADSFDSINSLVLEIPQVATNAEIVSGSVIVTLNSSLKWTFDVPAQKQKLGIITMQKTTNGENKIEAKVMPVIVLDKRNNSVSLFDGK